MSFLTVISEIGTVIQTIISLKMLSNEKPEHKIILEGVENRLKKLEHNRLIERSELLSIIKETSSNKIIYSKEIIQGLFGEYDNFEVANDIAIKQFNKGRPDFKNVRFEAEDFTFSSFGTAGYIKYLSDGKGVAVFHSTGTDKGRLFLIRWGIGWYYRNQLNKLSFLGFPISDEFSTKKTGRVGNQQDFEGGYIEYLEEYNKLRIFRTALKGLKLIGEYQF